VHVGARVRACVCVRARVRVFLCVCVCVCSLVLSDVRSEANPQRSVRGGRVGGLCRLVGQKAARKLQIISLVVHH